MSTTVSIQNLTASPLGHPEVPGQIAALATATRTYKQVNADDYSANFDTIAGSGVVVTEDGTLRPGVEDLAATATIADTTHCVRATTTGALVTLTLPAVANVDVGHRMYIYFVADGGFDVVVDGDGAELVLGSATQTLTDVGDVLRIQSDGTGWIAQT